MIKEYWIKFKVNNYNKKYFLEYELNNENEILILQNDLLKKINKYKSLMIKCECDDCKKDFNMSIANIHKYNFITLCKGCRTKKTNLEKYGVENIFQSKEIKEKIKKTNLEKYGVENPSQSEEVKGKKEKTCLENNGCLYPSQSKKIREKIKKINLERYGVENPSQLEEIKKKKEMTCLKNNGVRSGFLNDKSKETNLERYGHENPLGSKKIREKIKKNNLKKYGVENVFQSELIKIKIRKTLFVNGTAKSSKSQKYLCELLSGYLNFPFNTYSLDIAFPKEKLYIEYDGNGHDLSVKKGKITEEEFRKKENIREQTLEKLGWKLIRIISSTNSLLADREMIYLINYCKLKFNIITNKIIKIDLDKMIIYSKEFNEYIGEILNGL